MQIPRQAMSILDLSDDVLLCILAKMSIPEVLEAQRVCKTFRRLGELSLVQAMPVLNTQVYK